MPVQLLVGTRKGAFIYTADAGRRAWTISEPLLAGWSIHHMAVDTRRDPPRLYAAAGHWAWGPSVARSDDGGDTWEQSSPGLAFPQDMGISVQNVWNVRPGHDAQPGVVFAGVQPAGLFRSEDWGDSWAPVDTLNRHDHRTFWTGTGGGDSCLHSIELDPRLPDRFYVSISAGGSYRSEDGGQTWALCTLTAITATQGARAFIDAIRERGFPPALPDGVDPYAIDEMHKMRLDTANPDRIWGQTHTGVFRSDDRGDTWDDVTQGLPSFHGFPIAVSRNGGGAAYVVPLEFQDNNFRVCPGQLHVFRTRDAGAAWQRLPGTLPPMLSVTAACPAPCRPCSA